MIREITIVINYTGDLTDPVNVSIIRLHMIIESRVYIVVGRNYRGDIAHDYDYDNCQTGVQQYEG